jgi:hypothetical protein
VKRIPIDKAQPGQILAEKLTRHDGVLLAGQGSEITEGLLRMLGRMNIDTVVIEEEETRSAAEVEEEFRRFSEDLEARFVRIDEGSVLVALKKTMLYLAEKCRDETLALMADPAEGETGLPGSAAAPETTPAESPAEAPSGGKSPGAPGAAK